MEFDKEKIWWFEKLQENFYKDANITKFNLGRKLFNKRAITYLSIEDNEVESVVYDGRKNYYEVNIVFSQMRYFEAESLLNMFSENMHLAVDLINGDLSYEFYRQLLDRQIEILPYWSDIKYKCSCRKTKKCEHVSTVLHRIFNETIFEPMLIFELRGIKCGNIFSIILNDPDYEMTELCFPEELSIEYYDVKSSNYDTSGIDPQNYYGVEFEAPEISLLKDSKLTESTIFHGKLREEFYDIYDNLSELIKININKY